MSTTKKLLFTLISISAVTFSLFAYTSDEFGDEILPWLHENGFTKYSDVDDFRPNNSISRFEAAKFMSYYADFLEVEPGDAKCEFRDIGKLDAPSKKVIIQSCQRGYFRGNNGNFMPNAPFTESQALVVLMRSLFEIDDEKVHPWYAQHLEIALDIGLLEDENALDPDRPISREKFGIWIYDLLTMEFEDNLGDGDQDVTIYESEVDGPDECTSNESFDEARNVCYFECTSDAQCQSIAAAVDEELSGWTEALEEDGREFREGPTSDANVAVSYAVKTGEVISRTAGNDTEEYRKLWQEVAELSPDTLSDAYIEEFQVYDDAASDVLAYVVDEDGSGKWTMAINLAAHSQSTIQEQKATLIHEITHILTLNQDQFMSSTSCKTYQTEEGCTKSSSYLNTFVAKFWGKKKEDTFDETKFVTDYATSSPEEDIAESFAFFVLEKDFDNTNVRNQKVNFFNSYPELVEMRRAMRNVLAESVVRARKVSK